MNSPSYISQFELWHALRALYRQTYMDSPGATQQGFTWHEFLTTLDLGIDLIPQHQQHKITDANKFLVAKLKHGF